MWPISKSKRSVGPPSSERPKRQSSFERVCSTRAMKHVSRAMLFVRAGAERPAARPWRPGRARARARLHTVN